MKYGSVCSGVEAATVAWHPLGWQAQWFSEIEKFPSAVLQHHYPDTPNHGDMTSFKEWPNDPIDVLVGGTPCQSFSVAGLRKGLSDPRGNLMLTYLAIAAQYQPKWLVWENVPGVLSSNRGRDFGTFLGALAELGYGFAYRVLDAQYFGVAQRRRRVFVVGYLGDWKRATAVLFERESLSGHPAPSRETREETADTLTVGANQYSGFNGEPVVAGALDTQCGGGKLTHQSANNGHLILEKDLMGTLTARMFAALGARDVEEGALHPVAFDAYNQEVTGVVSKTVAARSDQDTASCIAFGAQNSARQGGSVSEHVTPTLDKSKTPAVAIQAQALKEKQPTSQGFGIDESGASYTLTAGDRHAVQSDMQVRRLTPTECERLQGFPDNYTQIPYRNKPAESCPDGPRYKAMGNSMAVPVMRWIGERINMVNKLQLPDTVSKQ
jgi:DNA (cytosine-5)-methyltransferase 1